MIKKISLLLIVILCLPLYGQTPEMLNARSKILIDQQKFEKAIVVLKQAAELGNAESQYNLGYCYRSGTGIEQNNEKAIEWYTKSADQGFNDALYQLMMAYGNGNGVEQDYNKAFSYALKCAKNNDEFCMFNVINCYKEGMGTEKSIDKMLEWAILLGKLENSENLYRNGKITSARLNLAYMYRDGKEIEKDLFKSYQWFLIYNEFKKDFSFIQQQQIVRHIQNLEKLLTAKQKENGTIEAENLLERPLKNVKNLYKPEI